MTTVASNHVEGPQKRKLCDMSSWHRIVGPEGETEGYAPDGATAKEHAAAPDLADALENLLESLTQHGGRRHDAALEARAALSKSGRR